MKNIMKIIFFILGVLVRSSNAESFDDFVNNLYSDLAPLLTLFGERVTMQFISQALGFADCVALAMAPLGIITIMVSAVRVGGPTLLKAVIGRAKENRAAAELELMSSTSREVCELFNGENIVRCLGSGSVWQYICLFRKGTGNGQVRFMTLQEATKEGLLTERHGKTAKEPQENTPSSQVRNCEVKAMCTATGFAPRRETTLQRMRRRVWKSASKETDKEILLELGELPTAQEPAKETDKGSTEPSPVPTEQDIGGPATITVVYDAVPEAPNISLNLQHLGTQTKIWATVILGVALQTGVLVTFGLINYSPKMQTILGIDKPLSPYGFIMSFFGTLLMVIGVFLCADVVERSTVEEVYEADHHFEMRLYWLQQDQTVNDQMFQSFATFSDGPCRRFMKSRRAETSHRKDTPQAKQVAKNLRMETRVGVGLGVVGFVMQFVGFRGLHPVAPLAQLVAIAIMTGCRTWARRGYTKNFQTAKLLHGFEQDWFAQQLAQYLATQNPVQKRAQKVAQDVAQYLTTQQPAQEPIQQVAQELVQKVAQQLAELHPTQQPAQQLSQSMDDGTKRQCTWSIVTGRDAEYRALDTLREGMGNHAQYSEAQRLLVMRRDLYRLVKFHAASSKCATNLAIAMERALGVLFPDGPGDGLGFRWVLDVEMTGTKQLVWIDLPFHQGDKGVWRVAVEDVHAALSLWMHTARAQGDEEKGPWYEDEDGTWLCRDVCEPALKALGEGNYDIRDQVIYDLTTLAPQSYDAVREIQGIWLREVGTKNESGRRLEPNCARAARSDPRTRLGLRKAETNQSIVDLYASEVLFSFMWSLAKTLRVRVNGEVEVQTRHDTSGPGPQEMSQLRSTVVTDLINAFRAASCWSEHETCLGVISPLSIMHKLPIPEHRLNDISTTIKDSLKSRDPDKIEGAWKTAFSWASRLFETCHNEGTTDRVVAWLLEQYHDFQDGRERAYEIPRLEKTAAARKHQELTNLIRKGTMTGRKILAQVTLRWSSHPFVYAHEARITAFQTHMKNLYELQRREMRFEFGDTEFSKTGHRKTEHGKTEHGKTEHGKTEHRLELPAWFDFTTLHEKAARGHRINSDEFSELRILVNVRDICGFTPLLYAAATKNWQLIETLLDMGANQTLADFRGYTAAHHACLSGCLESLKRLSDKTVMIARAMNGLMPIHLAAGKGNCNIIQYLRRMGPFVDFDGRTAAHWAAAGGHIQAVELLRVDVNIPDNHGSTPLHLAAMDGNLAMIEKLLELGAKLDVRNDRGETPLTYGIDRAKAEKDASRMTKAMARNLGPNLIEGRRAIDIARKRGFDSVARDLQVQIEAGADDVGEQGREPLGG